MAKTFKVLSVDTARSVMLVRFKDDITTHDTEIPFPPQLDTPDTDDDDLADWVASFWPHSIMEAPSLGTNLATKVGLIKGITTRVGSVAAARGKTV